MNRIIALALFILLSGAALAASGQRPPPPGAPHDAPPEFTHFSADELTRGFMALAFGSDLRIGGRPNGVRKFNRTARVEIDDSGSIKRGSDYKKILSEFAEKIPNLRVEFVESGKPADITVRLIDESAFAGAMEKAFGRKVARAFVARTDPQCMTSVKSDAKGVIVRADVFIIVDKGESVFFDCAYHETLHAFGLSSHDSKNPWTTLNQDRMVGYLTVYDRALLTALYDPRIRPGLSAAAVRRALPGVFAGAAP